MIAVQKYQLSLNIGWVQVVTLPYGAQLLKFRGQEDKTFQMWALVDDEAPKEDRTFYIVGTGHAVEKDWKYIDTYFANDGFVWHLFEEVKQLVQ